jgi:hypothetical protein
MRPTDRSARAPATSRLARPERLNALPHYGEPPLPFAAIVGVVRHDGALAFVGHEPRAAEHRHGILGVRRANARRIATRAARRRNARARVATRALGAGARARPRARRARSGGSGALRVVRSLRAVRTDRRRRRRRRRTRAAKGGGHERGSAQRERAGEVAHAVAMSIARAMRAEPGLLSPWGSATRGTGRERIDANCALLSPHSAPSSERERPTAVSDVVVPRAE